MSKIMMSSVELVSRLRVLAARPNFYKNQAPYNLCYNHADGSVSADCVNLYKALLNGYDVNLRTPGYFQSDLSNTGDVTEWGLMSQCQDVSEDFTKLKLGQPRLLYMQGHIGGYLGEEITINGHLYNVIECTTSWEGGIIYSYVSNTGGRFHYKGGEQKRAWSHNGLMTPWIQYTKGVSVNPGDPVVNKPNKLKDFLQEANKHLGENGEWTWQTFPLGGAYQWCAGFIAAVAKTVGGILDVIIPATASNDYMVAQGVAAGMGEFIKGAWWGTPAVPKPGDLITYRWNSSEPHYTKSEYNSNHIGIVYEVNGDKFTTVEGNTGDGDLHHRICKNRELDITDTRIHGYFRPNWAKVGGSYDGISYTYGGPLYTTKSTEEDATIREVCYLDKEYKPTTDTTKIRLCAVNYTSILAAVVDAFGGVGTAGSNGSVDTSGLTSYSPNGQNAKVIADILLGKGMNAAQVAGILANIQRESAFDPSAVNPSTGASGIVQWISYKQEMIQRVGPDWKNNLSGQADCVYYHITEGYAKNVGDMLREQVTENTYEQAYIAMEIWLRYFELAWIYGTDGYYNDLKIRDGYLKAIWDKLVFIPGTSGDANIVPVNGTVITQSGKKLSTGKQIIVPSPIKHNGNSYTQTGITKNYTNYSYWFSRWANHTNQRTIADLWNKAGKPSSRNIAVLGGYYLCAMSSTFGTTGDILTIVLEDNTKFNVILGDAKNPADANSTPYGHLLSGKVDIIEWEIIGSSTSAADNNAVTKVDLTNWAGKTVKQAINYGTYLQ